MEEPRTRIVSKEPDCDVIASIADAHNIPNDGVIEVVRGVASATDHMEIVSMQMNRVLSGSSIQDRHTCTYNPRKLTGPPTAPPGIVSSTLLFGSRPYMLPGGRSSDAVLAPLRIWRRTGTVGGLKGVPFISNMNSVKF
jgi:hypothetical protein